MGKNENGYGRDGIDLTGKRFGKLTVIKMHDQRNEKGEILWLCKCDCGEERLSISGSLQHGGNTTCGNHPKLFKHGQSGTRLFNIWTGMNARCSKKTASSYYLYGARGIQVCKEWREDFFVFKEWALNNGYQDDLSIDRFPDQNGDYGPDNCRWATSEEQNNNRVNNVLYEIDGELKTLTQWATIYKTSRGMAYQRIYLLQWDVKKALSTPAIPYNLRNKSKPTKE